jgi:hypothetical protein
MEHFPFFSGLRSGRVGEQCEAIVRFPRLFEKYPFPILINSSLLKLADVFRVGWEIFLGEHQTLLPVGLDLWRNEIQNQFLHTLWNFIIPEIMAGVIKEQCSKTFIEYVRFEVFTAVTMKNGRFLQEPHGVTSQKTPFFIYWIVYKEI